MLVVKSNDSESDAMADGHGIPSLSMVKSKTQPLPNLDFRSGPKLVCGKKRSSH